MDALTVAFAGVVSGAVIGTVGTLVSWKIAHGTWSHERTLAHEARIAEKRQHTYVDMLALVNTAMLVIERTEPALGPKPDPPALPSDEEWAELEARIAAYGSQVVLEAYEAFTAAYSSFQGHAMFVRQMRALDRIEPVENLQNARSLGATRRDELAAIVRTSLTQPQS